MSISDLLAGIDTTSAGLVSTIDIVLLELEKQGLAWKARIHCRQVGVHGRNRNGWGVSPAAVHQLGSEVFAMGWSPSATAHAVCAEDFDGSAATFTKQCQECSDGMLGTSKEIRYGSLSCSHTNQWLLAVLSGVKCSYENISVKGRMSYEVVSQQPLLKEALDTGMMWLVISAKACQNYPSLPGLVQAAKNATGAVHQREDSFQLLRSIQSLASSSCVVDWQVIANVVSRRSQVSVDEIKHLLAFAQEWGGGKSGTFVDDLCRFHKTFVKPGRLVPATTWQALADLKLQVCELCPFVVYAILKTQANCHDNFCDGKICKYISVGEINSLAAGRKQDMLAAEKVLAECRVIARNVNAPDDKATKALGRLDVFFARIVLGKTDKQDERETVQDATLRFARELGSHGSAASSEAVVGAVPNVVQYDALGSPVGAASLAMRSDGFDVGTVVKSTCDLKAGTYGLFKITKINEDGGVQMKSMQSDEVVSVTFDQFHCAYKKTNESYDQFSDWQERIPSKQSAYADAVDRAFVLTAVSVLAASNDPADLMVMRSPEKAVFTQAAVATGKLQLVPETLKISFENKVGSFKGTVGGRDFYLQPSFSADFAAVAWLVKGKSDDESVNMAVVLKKVFVTVGQDKKVTVMVPVLQNTCKLKQGDELIMKKEEVAAKSGNKRLLNLQPCPKAKAKK